MTAHPSTTMNNDHTMLTLKQIDSIPQGLLELESIKEIDQILSQPTLLHLEGKEKQPLFVSVLLHANEDTGFFAIQRLLRKYQHHELPRSVSIFFGNIKATRDGVRRLAGQPDYNRVWPGTEHPECEETRIMQAVVDEMAKRQPFASIDVHNNTGKNPHYGCINTLAPEFLHLSALFSRTVVFFETPKGVQSMAMAALCPAVTIECGQPHQPYSVEHATDYLDTVLHLSQINADPVNPHDVDVFQTVALVKVPKEVSFSFTDTEVDILFDQQLDKMNFSELTGQTVFASVKKGSQVNLEAWDDHEQNVSDDYFVNNGKNIVLTKAVMPAMLTLVEEIIRQDCLCYLMKRLALPT